MSRNPLGPRRDSNRLAYRVRDVVELLGVCERTVRTWIETGQLKSIRRGRVRLIPQGALDEFLDPK